MKPLECPYCGEKEDLLIESKVFVHTSFRQRTPGEINRLNSMNSENETLRNHYVLESVETNALFETDFDESLFCNQCFLTSPLDFPIQWT